MESESKLIIALMIAVLMGAVDSTIVILTLPTITVQLGATLSSSIWIIMIYLLVIAVGTTQLGRLGDILSRSYIFYINVPIGIFALLFAIQNIRVGKKVENRLDVPGIVMLALSLSLISYAAVDITSSGIDAFNEILIIIGLIFIVTFVMVERIVANPLLPLKIFRIRILSFSIMASFFQSLGFLAVVFIIIMYLQGIRGLSPLYSSLLLLPGYVVGSILGPYFGKLTDRIGSRIPATVGITIMGVAIVVYLTLTIASSLYVVLVGSFLTGTGSSMFYPANNSAVMANSPKDLYGLSSGFLRTTANIGMLGSFVIAISIASISVPRCIAFEVLQAFSTL
ncbi:MAG: MFS transporter [Thermoplasmataceae archaeon]